MKLLRKHAGASRISLVWNEYRCCWRAFYLWSAWGCEGARCSVVAAVRLRVRVREFLRVGVGCCAVAHDGGAVGSAEFQ
jgi:hypothetical protein